MLTEETLAVDDAPAHQRAADLVPGRPEARVLMPLERPTAPSAPGDGRSWTTGNCMWGCRRPNVPVLWVCDVASAGIHAPLYVCHDCLVQLDAAVWAWAHRRDGVPEPLAPPRRPDGA